MENLVGRKVKCVKRYRNLTEKKEYEIKSVNKRTFEITEDDGINDTWNIEWIKGYDEDGEYHFELLPNEPQFNQGDKVLVSDNGIDWVERIFVFEYKGYYNCELRDRDYTLVSWKYIKPYEDEIKVGDWYLEISNNAIRKATNCISENYLKNKNYCKKITNPQLIELLDKEL